MAHEFQILFIFAVNMDSTLSNMGDYIVSARKYRPSTFAAVVGQRALTTTLKNAIATGKLAHAYLFCGPRGVGKTTCARIFARTINCLAPNAEGEACGVCESCVAFRERRSYNIHELDAASNNSVEDIRLLIDQVRIPPQIGRYKVYIIDEVHMLSQAAFNAFLKTLEEPPHHAIFILATTEKHKILPTILSRCQIYDFSRISVKDAADYLAEVAQKEGIEAEPEALTVIAQKADGGMRDALSIFDQVVSFTGGRITYRSVIENLNVLDYEYYFRLTDAILAGRVADCLLIFNEILSKGFDGSHFITGLASHFRDLLVSRDPVTLPLLETGASIRERYRSQAQLCPVKFLYKAIRLSNDCDLNYRVSKNKRLLVEITLIRLAQLGEEEDDSPGGRRPEQKLKPIAPQQPVGNQPAAASAPQAESSAAAKKAAAAQSAPVATTPSPSSAQTAAGPAKMPAEGKKIPVIKAGQSLGFSIRRSNSAPAATVTQQEVGKNPAQETAWVDHAVDERTLQSCWREFAGTLPKEEKANSLRMMNIAPRLTDAASGAFEVVVDNDMVLVNMQKLEPKLLGFLREKLHNRLLTMTVRVSEPEENVRAFSPIERFREMSRKNPRLQKLQEELGLELE